MFKEPEKKVEKEEIKNTLTQKEIQDIEKIVDEAFQDSKDNKDEIDNILNEAFNEIEKGNKVLDNENLIYKEQVNVKNEVIKFRGIEHGHYIEIMKELHFLKKHYLKVTGTAVLIACFGAYIAGTQHNTIAPFVASAWEVVNIFHRGGE